MLKRFLPYKLLNVVTLLWLNNVLISFLFIVYSPISFATYAMLIYGLNYLYCLFYIFSKFLIKYPFVVLLLLSPELDLSHDVLNNWNINTYYCAPAVSFLHYIFKASAVVVHKLTLIGWSRLSSLPNACHCIAHFVKHEPKLLGSRTISLFILWRSQPVLGRSVMTEKHQAFLAVWV